MELGGFGKAVWRGVVVLVVLVVVVLVVVLLVLLVVVVVVVVVSVAIAIAVSNPPSVQYCWGAPLCPEGMHACIHPCHYAAYHSKSGCEYGATHATRTLILFFADVSKNLMLCWSASACSWSQTAYQHRPPEHAIGEEGGEESSDKAHERAGRTNLPSSRGYRFLLHIGTGRVRLVAQQHLHGCVVLSTGLSTGVA